MIGQSWSKRQLRHSLIMIEHEQEPSTRFETASDSTYDRTQGEDCKKASESA